jgi:ABC-type amino acid transport substrate-binding protein
MNRRAFAAAAVITALSVTAGVFAGTASAATLDRIGQDKSIRIAYRDDAPPFSYKDKIGEPVGFMVDLCREVAKKLADQLHLTSLKRNLCAGHRCRPLRGSPGTKGRPSVRADECHLIPARAGRLLYSDFR